MTQITAGTATQESLSARAWRWARGVNPVYLIALILLVWVGFRNPVFFQPDNFLTFLQRATPLMILTAGQVFVLVSGGFDLSVGSVVTSTVIIGAILANNDPGATWWVMLALLLGGLLVGLVNGAVTTFLKVPSLIATLGMLLVAKGVGLLWSGGAPRGYLPDNFRMWGRSGIEGVFGLQDFPYAVIVLVVFGIGYWLLLHRLNYGRQLLALGDNPRAARLSGVNVNLVRISAFVICSMTAVVAGVLLGPRRRQHRGGHGAGDAVHRRRRAGRDDAAGRPRLHSGGHDRRAGAGAAVHAAQPVGAAQTPARRRAGPHHHRRGGVCGV